MGNIRGFDYKEVKCRWCPNFFKPNSGKHYSCSEECKRIGRRKDRLDEYYRRKEYYQSQHRKWLSENKEKNSLSRKEWAKNNRELLASKQRRRKARLKGSSGSHTLQQWEELKKFYNYMCLCCKRQEPFIKLTEDHIIPIFYGGSDSIENIQPLCFSCNSSKRIKTISYIKNISYPFQLKD